MTITDYIDNNIENNEGITGFTIGRGKKIYWYYEPMHRSGRYRCLPIEADGTLGWPRFIYWDQIINVVFTK